MGSIRIDGPARGIVTKTVHKTLPGSLFVCLKLDLVQLCPFRSLPDLWKSSLLLLLCLYFTCVFDVNLVNCPGF